MGISQCECQIMVLPWLAVGCGTEAPRTEYVPGAALIIRTSDDYKYRCRTVRPCSEVPSLSSENLSREKSGRLYSRI
jgi:hypothetical protein